MGLKKIDLKNIILFVKQNLIWKKEKVFMYFQNFFKKIIKEQFKELNLSNKKMINKYFN